MEEDNFTLADMVGFYDWEDSPCEIRVGEDGETLEAVIYKPGIGFSPISPATVWTKAEPISEKRFKQLVMEMARTAR